MAESKEYMTLPEENGSINISEEVIAAIAVGAVREVEGVSGMMTTMGGSYLLVSVQTIVDDLGKTAAPHMSQKTELLLSRIASALLALGALAIALYIKSAYDVLMFAWAFYAAAAGLPALAALYWKKATSAGVIAGMVGGFAVTVGWKLAGQPFGLGATVPGAITCGVLLVAVSLATYKKHPSVMVEV